MAEQAPTHTKVIRYSRDGNGSLSAKFGQETRNHSLSISRVQNARKTIAVNEDNFEDPVGTIRNDRIL